MIYVLVSNNWVHKGGHLDDDMADKYPIILASLYFATATADVLRVFGFQHVNIYINILLVVFYELLTIFTKTVSPRKNDFMDN